MCDLLATTLGTDYQARRFEYTIGNALTSGQRSTNGLYAIMSIEKNVALRISTNVDIAAMYNECDSIYLAEAWLREII